MFNRQVTLKTVTARSSYGGKETYSTTTVWARFTGETKKMIDESTHQDYSAEVIILEADATPTLNSTITYDSRDYKVVECVSILDKDNNTEQWQVAIR